MLFRSAKEGAQDIRKLTRTTKKRSMKEGEVGRRRIGRRRVRPQLGKTAPYDALEASQKARLAGDGEETTTESVASFDLTGEERSGCAAWRHRRRLRRRAGERREEGGFCSTFTEKALHFS